MYTVITERRRKMNKMYMESKKLTCTNCENEITTHADGSSYCCCNSRKIGDGRRLPASWRGEDRDSYRKYMRYVSKL